MRIIKIINEQGIHEKNLQLPEGVFSIKPHYNLLSRVVHWQMANKRGGNHSVKMRGDVQGSTRKTAPQKGRGASRRSDEKAPQYVGGGVSMGPKSERNHGYILPKKMKRIGLHSAITLHQNRRSIFILEDKVDFNGKSKLATDFVKKITSKENTRILFIGKDKESHSVILRALSNVEDLDFIAVIGLNVISILKADYLIVYRSALDQMIRRCGLVDFKDTDIIELEPAINNKENRSNI